MPPPKKAAKKTAKKAAKKTAGHHHDGHRESNDLRRAFEHMGRLEVLRTSLTPFAAEAVAELTRLAQEAILGNHNRDAADVLRAAEHLSFAVLAGDGSDVGPISAELRTSITEQFDELMRRAEEHWADNAEPHAKLLASIFQSTRKSAAKAFKANAYHQALEFARAAEALAHVKQDGRRKLARGQSSMQLTRA
jgi:hypothetical protein